MHTILLVEGYTEGIKQFEQFFNGKVYANGKSKVRMREVKLYTCSLNKEGYKEFLADIKPIIREKKEKTLFGLIRRLSNIFSKIFGKFKSMDDDVDKVKRTDTIYKANMKGIHFNCWIAPIGKVEDRYSDGKEQV